MNQSINTSKISTLSPISTRIAFIEAGWHQDIVAQSRTAFTDEVAKNGMPQNAIDIYSVPGSLEIPLQCKLLAKSGRYDLIVAAGLIVDGDIYRHDFVASTVLDGMMQVQLAMEIPILSIVLTPHHFSNSTDHHDFFFRHFKQKGIEAANACLSMLQKKATYDLI